MHFTNQSRGKAIVPLTVGYVGEWKEAYSGTFSKVDVDDRAYRNGWQMIYGVYSFRNADIPGEPVCYAEASMLVADWWHDFCGGVQVSSASVRIHSGGVDLWGGSGLRMATLAPRAFSQFTAREDTSGWVPSLHNALRSKTALHHAEAQAILSRSLMYWCMSNMYSKGKRGFLAFDREAENRGTTRRVMRHARDITSISTRCPSYVFRENPNILSGLSATTCRNWVSYENIYQVPLKNVTVDEGKLWVNKNSGALVGPVQVFFECDDEEEEIEEVYNEDTDEYESVPTERNEVLFPDWYTTPAFTAGYERLMPLFLFNNNG